MPSENHTSLLPGIVQAMFPGISGMLGFRVLSECILRLGKSVTQLVLLQLYLAAAVHAGARSTTH